MQKILVVLAAMGGLAVADTVVTPAANTFVNIPAGFMANTGLGNIPYWNNPSIDGANLNIGDFVTNQGGFAGGTLSPTGSQYLATVANPNNAPLSFTMLRQQTSINVTLLYQNSAQNNGPGGTAFGIYDVNNPASRITIFSSGTVPANVGTTVSVNTAPITGAGTYGFWATACQFSMIPLNCFTFFSDTALNPDVTNNGSSFVVEGSTNPHQHFALFTLNGNATTFYLGFENSITNTGFDGTGGPERYGDFNDVILRITTANIPEPATMSMMGLGLLALGLIGRRLRK